MAYIRNRKYEEFYSYVFTAYTHLATNTERLYITEERLEEFGSKVAAFANLYFGFTNPRIQTALIVAQMHTYYTEAFNMLQQFRAKIAADINIELTPEDIAELRLKPRAKRYKRAERPDYAPLNEVLINSSVSVKILTYRLGEHGRPLTSIPEQRMVIERRLAITDSKTQPQRSEYQSLGFSSRSRYTLTFTPEQAGMHAHLITAYKPNAGKRGPWSKSLTFTITP